MSRTAGTSSSKQRYERDSYRFDELNGPSDSGTVLLEQQDQPASPQERAGRLRDTSTSLEDHLRQRTRQLSESVADLERSHEQMLIAKEAAERANKSKTRVLAAASHDVLQPLNAALLLMSTLSSLQSSEEGVQLCRQVERSLETMDTLLRNLLFMSRLDAGDVKPHMQRVSLDKLFDSIASDFQPIAQVRDLELRVRHSGLHVWSDPTMLRRTIQNIVANALRYTRSGGALLIAGKRGQSVKVRIADTGVGIARERYQDIFVEFERCGYASAELDRSSAGMGLGLAIVKRMVDRLNIKLALNSRVGHGTCFSLVLPLADSIEVAGEAPCYTRSDNDKSQVVRLSDTRILVVEDDLAALQALEALLRQWGCDLRLAVSGREAMGALNDTEAWAPDIILADQYLDDNEKGTSVVRMIRQMLGYAVPALIVTANPSDSLWRVAGESNLDVMEKPLKPAQLRALLAHMRSKAAENISTTNSPA